MQYIFLYFLISIILILTKERKEVFGFIKELMEVNDSNNASKIDNILSVYVFIVMLLFIILPLDLYILFSIIYLKLEILFLRIKVSFLNKRL